MDFEAVIFDTAPTGHTLRLLQFPTILENGLGKILRLKNSFGPMVSQVSVYFRQMTHINRSKSMCRLVVFSACPI